MKAIICGAGIAGLTLAWWLERDGWTVQLVERTPEPRHDGFMIDFFGPGYEVAELMGLLPDLRDVHADIGELAFVNPDERNEGHLGYSRLSDVFGGQMLSFMHGELERILHTAVADRVTIRNGTTVDGVEETAGGVAVTTSDGRVDHADVLVGADGRHSRIRELVFGPEQRFLRYLGYHTAAYMFDDEDVRARVGDRFLLVGAPGRQAAFYPTSGGQLAMSLVHATPDPDLPPDPHASVRKIYGQLGGLVRRALRHCPDQPQLFYDQVAQVDMDTWRRGRVILVGDACQAMSPMAGEGASIAMGAAYVLADELGHGDVESAAVRYENRLREVVRDKQRAGRRTARWLAPTTPWRIRTRGWALAAARLPGGARLIRAGVGATPATVIPADARQLAGVL